MNIARVKLPKVFINKSKKEIKSMIEENIFNEKYKDVAISYYVYEKCQIDIAMSYDVDKKTIKKILDKVIKEIEMA